MASTYWLPYPSLLKGLGFTKNPSVKDCWQKPKPVAYTAMYTLRLSGSNIVLDSPSERVFKGELSSEEDFHIILRLVKWDLTP